MVQIFINAVIWRHLALLTAASRCSGAHRWYIERWLDQLCDDAAVAAHVLGLSTASCDWRPQAAAIILAQTLLFTAVVTWVVRARATNLKIAAAA